MNGDEHLVPVAEILAKAAAEDWPTSSLSLHPCALGEPPTDDLPTEPIPIIRPYVHFERSNTQPAWADVAARQPHQEDSA